MPCCPECDKCVALTEKFCRNCGVSPLGKSSSNLPSSVLSLATPPCAYCGTPLGPDEKT